MAFTDEDIAVVMTGEEWFAILARINFLLQGKTVVESHDTFSRKGAKILKSGMSKLQDQILAASAIHGVNSGRNRKKAAVVVPLKPKSE